MYRVMRHLPYKWNDILQEEVPRTFISNDLINQEIEEQNKMEKAKRKRK